MRAKAAIRAPVPLPSPVEPEPVGVEIKAKVSTWPADLQMEWAERAAIIEYMGGETRKEAERQAFAQLDPDAPPSGATSRRRH